jgi:hypothetical protein
MPRGAGLNDHTMSRQGMTAEPCLAAWALTPLQFPAATATNTASRAHTVNTKRTRKTSVLLSSIFFIADSVVSGHLSTAYWSSFCTPTALCEA